MKPTVVVIGANGQLGSDLVLEWQARGHAVVPLTHHEIEVESIDSVRSVLTNLKPGIVLNTAAFHNVPKCEEEPAKSYAVNALGALHIANVAEELGATDAYFSTDYVFDGEKRSPYVETDKPNPLNVYAGTKLLGEYHSLNYSSRGFVFRVSGIYGRVPCRAKGGNFITTMIRLAKEKPEVKVVQDEILTPTPTTAIASSAATILERGAPGLYHLTCEGECSWYQFARVIFDELRLTTPLLPTTVKDFPSPVKRPFYSVLENANMKAQGIPGMPHWKDSLTGFLRNAYGR